MPVNPREDGEVLKGQLIDKEFRAIIPYTQQVRNFSPGDSALEYGQAGAELTPIDANATEVKKFDYTTIDAAKLALFYHNPGFTSFQLPEELLSLTSVFSTSKGVGAGNSVPHATSAGTSWSIGISASNHAASSLDYIPDLLPDVKTFDASNVPTIECYFFTSGNKTLAQILALLTTGLGLPVLVWPSFRPKRHSLTLKGQNTSLSSSASAQLSGSVSPGNTTLSDNAGYDYSIETRSIVRTLDLPPYLHGSLTIAGTGMTPWTASDTITVTAAASITGTGSIVGTVTGGTSVPTQTVTALITPHAFSATSPSAVPTTGLYLKEIRPQANEGDLFLQLAIVVDFAYFA